MCAKPVTPSTTRVVPTGEVEIHVTEYGNANEPLILVHGIGSDHSSWWPVVDQLAAHFRLLIPDQRGHGTSQKPDSGYALEDYARDLDALISAYGIDSPSIVGHSLGGMVTLAWAKRNPSRARKLVIEDSPLRTAENVDDLFKGWIALASSTPAEAAAVYARDYPHWSEEDCLRRAQMITSTHLAVFEESRARSTGVRPPNRFMGLSAIESPALLVYGDVEFGGMVPEEDATRFAATLPNGTATFIPGGTHSLHRDSVEQFLAATIQFLLG